MAHWLLARPNFHGSIVSRRLMTNCATRFFYSFLRLLLAKTCGSLLAALDVHPRVAMQILRHSKIAVTMEIYTEVPSAATRDALRRLGQWLDS